uniref:Uncharacterized protein n=1 Tax=Anguilla anguilla TaxID=7936 RepID=A0A0E9WCY2_ANGAN
MPTVGCCSLKTSEIIYSVIPFIRTLHILKLTE